MQTRILERGKTSGRQDDNEDSIKKRFNTFVKETMPVVDVFEKEGRVRRVNAVAAPDVVYSEVERIMEAEFGSYQTTFAFIKPDAVKNQDSIIKLAKEAGFEVVAMQKRHLTKDEAKKFYAEHEGRPFYDGLVTFMTSGPAVALALRRPDAIKAWRELMGPTKTDDARQKAPASLKGPNPSNFIPAASETS